MGWWTQNEEGESFALVSNTDEMFWGDPVADIMDAALKAISEEFASGIGRRPTKAEVRAGLEFSLGGTDGEEV